MKAGFARVCITPPIGTKMMGFAARDRAHGCEGVHDDIFVRALYVEHDGEPALIVSFDLCFVGREDADRMKGAIGRYLDLKPRHILMNTSHTHVGPSVGTWAYAEYEAPDRLYLRDLDAATVAAAIQARDAAVEATLWAGTTRTTVPMHRRGRNAEGKLTMMPNPDGPVYDEVPICLIKNSQNEPLALLFAISCHPSINDGFLISAEYPGVAMNELDAHLGRACSMFLQGAGGDAKPAQIGDLRTRWRVGTWEDTARVGGTAAREVITVLKDGLVPMAPKVWSTMHEMAWPLDAALDRAGYRAIIQNPLYDLHRMWAQRQIEKLDRYGALPAHAPIIAQGIQLGDGLRIIGIEGELVAEMGFVVRECFATGVTFVLGYANGEGLYLPTSKMLAEGGYESVSFWEYGFPSPLASGVEEHLKAGVAKLKRDGIC